MVITKEMLEQNLTAAEQNIENAKVAANQMIGKAIGVRDMLREQIAFLDAEEKKAVERRAADVTKGPEPTPERHGLEAVS